MKKISIISFLIFLSLATKVKAESTMGVEVSLGFNLTPSISVYYKPLENPYDLSYELKLASYSSWGLNYSTYYSYSLGIGIKKYFGTFNFVNAGILLFAYENNDIQLNAIQLGGEIGIGREFDIYNITGSGRLSLGGSTNFRDGFGIMVKPELGVNFKL